MSDMIYALYPLNENQEWTGSVYIGITSDIKRRIREHVYSGQYWIGEKPVTDFVYQTLYELNENDNPYIEYDYIELFRAMGMNVLNKRIGNHSDPLRAFVRMLGKGDFHYASKEYM